jgi:hypothetical protein
MLEEVNHGFWVYCNTHPLTSWQMKFMHNVKWLHVQKLQDAVAEVIPVQKCNMNMGHILNGYRHTGFWNVAHTVKLCCADRPAWLSYDPLKGGNVLEGRRKKINKCNNCKATSLFTSILVYKLIFYQLWIIKHQHSLYVACATIVDNQNSLKINVKCIQSWHLSKLLSEMLVLQVSLKFHCFQ